MRNSYGVNVSRVLRGDIRLLATDDLRLQYGDHRDLHRRRHSFPTRRSSDLITRPENINGNWNVMGAFMFNCSIDSAGVWNLNSKCVREFACKNEITNYFDVGKMGIEHALLPEQGPVSYTHLDVYKRQQL